MKRVLIKNGQVVDPANDRGETMDVLLEGDKVAAIGESMSVEGAEIIDAEGCVVSPGFIDLHTHLREPGQEYKEDIASGTRAAARGGFTAVVAMANTEPVTDDETGVRFVDDTAQRTGVVRVYPAGAITKGQNGEELAEMGIMAEAGARVFSDDGKPVAKANVMQHALEYSRMLGLPVAVHEELPSLKGDGVVNRGVVSTVTGLSGISPAAESAMVARDIELCRLFGGHLHISHISTARSIQIIEQAKEEGLNITCEVTPHHLALTEDLVRESNFDTNTKVNPPLRTEEDRQALVVALREGIIDAVATDHAPHSIDDKDREYIFADFGISGLETSFALLHDRLVLSGELSLERLIESLTWGPAQCFDLPGGTLGEGEPADICIFDTDDEWAVRPEEFASKGHNTPLIGWSLTGRVRTVLVGGKMVLQDGELLC